MQNLTDEQIDKRTDELPQNLANILFDYEILSKVDSIAIKQGFFDEKKEDLFSVFGQVIMGFIKLSDLETEIRKTFSVDDVAAKSIAKDLNEKIFNSLKPELDKLSFSENNNSPKKESTPTFINNFPATINLKNNPSPNEKNVVPPKKSVFDIENKLSSKPAPPPTPVEETKEELSKIPLTPFTPPPASIKKQVPPPSVPSPKPLEEVLEPLSSLPSFSSPTPLAKEKPSSPPFVREQNFMRPAPGSSPFIIHEESSFKPIIGSLGMEKAAVPQMEGIYNRKENIPSIKARVEIGKVKSRWQESYVKENVTAKTEPEKRKIVNYSAFVTPDDPFKKVNTAAESLDKTAPPQTLSPDFSKITSAPAPLSPLPEKNIPINNSLPKKEELSGPKVLGNTVDLRNQP